MNVIQSVDRLDAQDPRVLAKLRTLDIGQRPPGGWEAFLGRRVSVLMGAHAG